MSNQVWPNYLLFCRTGCWRRLWVLCQTTAGDTVFCPQLLRGVWQRRRHDECGRFPYVLFSGRQSLVLVVSVHESWFTICAADVFITTIILPFRSWSRQRKKQSTSMEEWIQDAPSPRLAPLRHRKRGERLAPTLLFLPWLVSGPRPRRLPQTLQPFLSQLVHV